MLLKHVTTTHVNVARGQYVGAGGVVVSFSAFYAGGRGFDSHIHQS